MTFAISAICNCCNGPVQNSPAFSTLHIHTSVSLSLNWGWQRDRLADLERMLMILDGKPIPDNRADVTRRLGDHISAGRSNTGYEDAMFTIRYFQKGTAHITFKRSELVDKLNDIIARHYPEALTAR